MARKRAKGSKQSLGNLGLDKEEDELLLKLMAAKDKDTSLKQLVRFVMRQWMKENMKLLNKSHEAKS